MLSHAISLHDMNEPSTSAITIPKEAMVSVNEVNDPLRSGLATSDMYKKAGAVENCLKIYWGILLHKTFFAKTH